MENFTNKGQSALEYLMTYGWALVVIVIAVAALVILINPQQLQGNRCDSKIGPFALSSESSVLPVGVNLVMTNTLGVALSEMDFQLGTTPGGSQICVFGACGTSGGVCKGGGMTAGQTKNFPYIGLTTGMPTSGQAYTIAVQLKYATPNVTGNNRPTVAATCTGTMP